MANITHALRADLRAANQRDLQRLMDAEAEYQSWLDVLNVERIHHCPDGRLHDDAPVHPSTGYAFVCVRCGHHSILPF